MINIGIARPVNIAQIRPVIARILETPIIISGEAPFPLISKFINQVIIY